MDKKRNVYRDLRTLLRLVLNWLDHGGEEKFDLDEDFIAILKKYEIKSSFGVLGEIYTYLDVVCDAKRHYQKDISTGYTIQNAKDDILYIITLIEQNDIEQLEKNKELIERLKKW